MKYIMYLGMLACLAGAAMVVEAEETVIPAAPKGGRLLENAETTAEFFLESDHTATITFYDSEMKPVAAQGQQATVIALATEGKVAIEFESRDGVLVTKDKLPEGDGYNLTVQLRQNAEAKPQNYRFTLLTELCGECQRAEYGCTCGH
jgi:hypothetical protein